MNARYRWLAALICVATVQQPESPAHADSTAAASPPAELEQQHALLNKKLDLSGLQQYSPTGKAWKPLPPSAARVRVVNLWSLACQPCIDELPLLTQIAEKRSQVSRDVQFLFVADPPDDNPRATVEAFWTQPFVARLTPRCQAESLGKVLPNFNDGQRACRLDLHRTDVVRGPRLPLSTEIRPLTLLLDPSGTIRHVFLGSLRNREHLLEGAIDRLLQSLRGHASAAPPSGRPA